MGEKRTTQATAEPSEISFTGAVTSTQISRKNPSSKRHKSSPPCDKFKKPLPKRQRTDPVETIDLDDDDDDFGIIEDDTEKKNKEKSKEKEKENMAPTRNRSLRSQRRTYVDDD